MATAAAAAAAMAPPGCPGSCPNFAVVCSFLERYGPLLDLPELPFPELERVLQAPPPDVGHGEGKRGARTPGGKRPWHPSSLLFRDAAGFRGSLLPLRRSSAGSVFSALPPGSWAVGRRGGGPLGPLGRAPGGGGGRRGLGVGWGRGGVIVLLGCPWDCYLAAEAGPPPLLPLCGGGRGAQVPASFALFSSSSLLLPPLLPPSSRPSRGRLVSSSRGAPFSSATWVGGGQRTLQLSLPLVGSPRRE